MGKSKTSKLKQLNRQQMTALMAAVADIDPKEAPFSFEMKGDDAEVKTQLSANAQLIQQDLPRVPFIFTGEQITNYAEISEKLLKKINSKSENSNTDRSCSAPIYNQADFTAPHAHVKAVIQMLAAEKDHIKPQFYLNANSLFSCIAHRARPDGDFAFSGFAKVMLTKQSVFALNNNGETSYFLPDVELQRLISIAEEKFKSIDRPMTEWQSSALDSVTKLKNNIFASDENVDLSLYLDRAIADDNLKQIFKNSILPSGQVSLVPLRFIPTKWIKDKGYHDTENTLSYEDALTFSEHFKSLWLSDEKERFFNAFSFFLFEKVENRNKLDLVSDAKFVFDSLGALYESLKKKKNGAELLKKIELAFYEGDHNSALNLLKEEEYRDEFFIFLDILKVSLKSSEFLLDIKNQHDLDLLVFILFGGLEGFSDGFYGKLRSDELVKLKSQLIDLSEKIKGIDFSDKKSAIKESVKAVCDILDQSNKHQRLFKDIVVMVFAILLFPIVMPALLANKSVTGNFRLFKHDSRSNLLRKWRDEFLKEIDKQQEISQKNAKARIEKQDSQKNSSSNDVDTSNIDSVVGSNFNDLRPI
jgi:hypothetical protein